MSEQGDEGRRPLGVRVAIFSLFFCLVLGCLGQAISFFNWQLAMRLRLQEDDLASADMVEKVLAHMEWGVAAADTLFVTPLFLVGFVGVVLRRRWGVIAAMMASGCWIYMWMTYTLQRYALSRGGLVEWGDYASLVVAFAVIGLVPCLLVLWGLGRNAGLFFRTNSHRLRRRGEMAPSFLENFFICSAQVLGAFFPVMIGGRKTWNVGEEEVAKRLSGDELLEPTHVLDRAITIDRPPEEIWPWLAQFGRGAGYYSWDFLDNRGCHHADYLIEGPGIAIGDKMLGHIVRLEPGRELVWFDTTPFMGNKMNLAMDFRLDPIGDGSSRVHYRMSAELPKTIRGRFAFWIGGFMDHVMSVEMLKRLKLLAETYPERLVGGETNCHLAPHQKDEWVPAADVGSA